MNELRNFVYVASFQEHGVAIVDCENDSLIVVFPIGINPWRVCVNSTTNRIYLVSMMEGIVYVLEHPLGVEENVGVPLNSNGIMLLENQPNPFRRHTLISYSLAHEGHVIVSVYDVAGQLISTLVDEHIKAGMHSVEWLRWDTQGNQVPSGVYFCRLQCNGRMCTKKMIVIE